MPGEKQEDLDEQQLDVVAKLFKVVSDLEKRFSAFEEKVTASEKAKQEPAKSGEPPEDPFAGERESIEQQKAELFEDYKAILASKHGITEGIDSYDAAKVALSIARGNKIGLKALPQENESGGSTESNQLKPFIDTSAVKRALTK